MKLFFIILILSFATFAQSEAEKQGREIFDKYQSAIGGKENLARIKTVETIVERENSNGKIKEFEIEDIVNHKKYTSIEINGRLAEMGSNGKSQWTRQNGRAFDAKFPPPGQVKKYRKLPNEKIDDKEYLVVEEIKEDSRENAKTYYDTETFLLMRRENMAGVGGNTFKLTTVYSDYRKVNDVLTPFLEVSYLGSSGKSIRKVLSIRYNIEVNPKIFEKDGITPQKPKELQSN